MESGGERFEYIAALNDRPEHIDALVGLIESEAQSWLQDTELGLENNERQSRYDKHEYNKPS